ncbi:MAG: iron ABC transporter permease [Bacteroidales bacterium OttesenSCG-928-I14]|jgi:iron complex transport system permease protein|nr:iron ABC transporter permease [Bacteroidales bacterium OttesenSCG-928-I14]
MHSKNRCYYTCLLVIIALIVTFFFNLFYGSVSIPVWSVVDIFFGKTVDEHPVWKDIVLQLRVPQAVTALLSGSALSVVGLMLQTLFQNSLASPDILGISSGANIGVAFVLLYCKKIDLLFSLKFNLSIVVAAFVGALLVLSLILYFSIKLKDHTILLVVGVLVTNLASSIISTMNSLASSENIRSYVLWGLGNFSDVSVNELPFFSVSILIGLLSSFFLIKPLNTLFLGEYYAFSLGTNIKKVRILILLISGFLVAIVTAFCGPISLLGWIVPCIVKMILKTSNFQLLIPTTIFLGSFIALFCNLISVVPFLHNLIPLNAVIQLLGLPVIIYIIVQDKKVYI